MSERIRGNYDDALYISTYTLLYFTLHKTRLQCHTFVSVHAHYRLFITSQFFFLKVLIQRRFNVKLEFHYAVKSLLRCLMQSSACNVRFL